MERKSCTQSVRFLIRCLPSAFTFSNDVRSRLEKQIWRPWKVRLDTWKAILTNLTKLFRQKSGNFSLKVQNKFHFFFTKKYCSSKYSSWHREFSFDKASENLSSKIRKVFTQSPKRIKKTYFYPKKGSPVRVEWIFDNPTEYFYIFSPQTNWVFRRIRFFF